MKLTNKTMAQMAIAALAKFMGAFRPIEKPEGNGRNLRAECRKRDKAHQRKTRA